MRRQSSALPRGTVTFLFTDIEGSTELVRRLRDRYGEMRTDHVRMLREVFSAHGGTIIDTQGDACFVAFDRAQDAVAAAIAAQQKLAGAELAEGMLIRVRMGLHTAEPYLDEGGYVGIGVHRAARICAAAHGGQILVSNATAGIVEDQEVADLEFRDLGEYRLKDIARPQRLFSVVASGLESTFGPPQAAEADNRRDKYGRVGTLLATDIVGWSRIIRAVGDDAAATVARDYRQIVRDRVADHGGATLEAFGDGVLAVFDRARDAVTCAAEVLADLRSLDWGAEVQPEVRAAVHTGRLVAENHGGLAVWHCLQLCDSAEPWQVLVSHSTEALLEGELPGLDLRDLGERKLSQSDSSRRVFELVS